MRIIKQVISLGWVLLLPAFITSCAWIESLQNPTTATAEAPVLEPTKFKILLIDTPQVKFYDFASFKYGKTDKNLTIDLYKLGKPISQIKVSSKEVCMMKKCTAKWIASKSFFGSVSYPNLFSDIVRARDIFDGEGKRVGNNGEFVQWFVKGGQEIYYERSKNRVLFKNLTTGVTIGVEDYIPN
ncbi:hypothetical protein LS68_000090 [Helicobacter sp. MIT 05-5293]|uniref:HP0838 family lipoprotein n=1 Tax=Helicobacter sp. MIT 05-5293 TaxID=1548149 RepID=UPI000ACDD93F|nr:hypothetical protein [Helicobacter sp. MIT 05-5293]TLD81482.1 hypothetical protein LS68_000090 [Helicobacter sp. MIT 05-5293]